MPEATFPPIQVPGKGALYARFVTSMGNVVIKLEEERTPKTVKNFVGLAMGTQEWKDPRTGETKKGVPYYDGTIFHRVISNFMIQGGGFEPGMRQKKTKAAIANESSNGLQNKRGTLAMARTNEPNSATSQFFVNVKDNGFLDRSQAEDGVGYCVFGHLTDGLDVLDKIKAVPTGRHGSFGDVPSKDVVIVSVRRVE
jgi:peptidyl-prolyl cis-trans isomerase B (cyclophilin B)